MGSVDPQSLSYLFARDILDLLVTFVENAKELKIKPAYCRAATPSYIR
jgi:hypothetical protein